MKLAITEDENWYRIKSISISRALIQINFTTKERADRLLAYLIQNYYAPNPPFRFNGLGHEVILEGSLHKIITAIKPCWTHQFLSVAQYNQLVESAEQIEAKDPA